MADTGNPMDAMMGIFMAETNDFLDKIENLLIENEQSGTGIREAIPEIFRVMHTIKSSSAMMSMDHISTLAHKVEDLFYYLRENPAVQVDEPKLVDIVLEAVDFIKRNLDGQQKEDPAGLVSKIGAYLNDIKSQPVDSAEKPPEIPKPAVPQAEAAGPESDAKKADEEQTDTSDLDPEVDRNKTLTVWLRRDCQMMGLRSLEIIRRVQAVADELISVPEDPTLHEDMVRENGLLLLVKTSKTAEELEALIKKSPFVGRVAFTGQSPSATVPAASPNEPVRQYVERRRDSPTFGKVYANVEISKLDNLVDLVAEIQILQMELSQTIDQQDWKKSESALVKLKKLILTLQEATLSTRMIPIRETFLKMNRIVRDMARKQGKEIHFVTKGEDTEVDRGIIEHISTPLMHIIRNAIDHGIESAGKRASIGKPETGRVELVAYTEGRNVIVSVTDDGGGLNSDAILAKAQGLGLVTDIQVQTMSKEEINALIFLPGFSTNKEVTEFSGRGVGMDVVNESLKKMNGKVIVQSDLDKGTKVTMKIPLTLAIIDTMILRVGTEMCAIPVSAVDKFLYMDGDSQIRRVNGEDMIFMQDECFRILNLFDYYGATEHIPYEEGVMIIINSETKRYVAFASEVLDRQDVVVKPAPPLFKTIRGISGCTVLGDGRISLILDTDELMDDKR